MNTLFQAIEAHKDALCEHNFCQYLRQNAAEHPNSFAFVPHMTFFVLGFKDMLENFRIKEPKTTIEEMINEHCNEDADHWEWFLQDLRTLKLGIEEWGGDISSAISLIWSDSNFAVRNQVYRVMHHVFQCKTPHEKLILMECLEAAFAAFVVNLNVLTQKTGHYKKLKYFGEHHFEKESDHAMGSWLDDTDKKVPMPHQAKYSIRENYMQAMIDDIFAGFNQVFSAWEFAMIDEQEAAVVLN
jgi:hypothetical protein